MHMNDMLTSDTYIRMGWTNYIQYQSSSYCEATDKEDTMKFLIVAAAILGVSMAGAPDNRGKRGLVSSLGYGYDASLGLSSLHLPLASSVVAAPTVLRSSLPLHTSVLSAPTTVVKTVHTAPVVKTVLSHPQVLSYSSLPSLDLHHSSLDLHGLNYGSVLPSVYSGGLVKSYNLGGLPVTSHLDAVHAW